MDTDVDDTGALAVLYSYVQEGRAEVLATVGSCNSGCAVKCIGGINAYYGFPKVPVGISPTCPSSGKSSYQSVIAERYGKDYPDDKTARPALEVYREVLSSAEDKSVVITVIGALNNLCDLLKSESDKYSPLNGTDLVRQKVKLCVIMGGRFPKSAPVGEYNIRLDVDAAYYVVHNCPASILWSGQEIGGSIFTGNMRNEMEEDNPVRLAYNLYGNDETGTYTRESWDLTTLVYAVEGAGDYWDIQTGSIEINTEEKILVPDYGPAYNNWTACEGKDAILIQKMNPEKIAEKLNKRMVMAKKINGEGDNLNMDDNKKAEMFVLSDNQHITFEECFDNLKHTRDFDLYLDVLNCLKNKYLIILSVRDISSQNLSDALLEKIHNIGFSNYKTDIRSSYVGIINSGNVIYNEFSLSAENPVLYDGTIGDIKIFVSSKLPKFGNKAEIIIDSEDYSLNEKGLNFVVYDCEKQEVVDSSGYDLTVAKPTFYHRNLFVDKQYIDEHIHMPKKNINNIILPIKRSYFSNRKLMVQEIERGFVLPDKIIDGKCYGGVCDKQFNFIAGTKKFLPERPSIHAKYIYGSYSVQPEDMEYIDETVVYCGPMIDHPGHLIIEGFADRVWWFIKNADNELKIAVTAVQSVLSTQENDERFSKEFFDVFGISEDRIIYVRKPTQFKKIIVPDQCFVPINEMYPYEFTSEYTQVFEHMKRNLVPAKYKKIYLTKKQTIRQNIIGEDYFIKFFGERGYKIINPEEYTVKEKAELMYGADEVVTVAGTNSLYACFCKPSVKLTVLSRQRHAWMVEHQPVNEAVGIKDFYLVNVSCKFTNKSFHELTLLGVTNEFKQYVKKFFGEELNVTFEESIKEYLYAYCQNIPEYYSVPRYFNVIKNIKMLDILQIMSEVFLGKDFDTSKLDLSTNESNLQNQVKNLTAQKNDLTSKINALTKENESFKSSKASLEDENKRLNAQLKSMSDVNEALKQQLHTLENTNKTLMSANSHLAQSMTEISSLLKNNTDLGE